MPCFPVKIGTIPTGKARVPSYQGAGRTVALEEIIDDRQAPADFARSPHKDLNLKQLKEAGLEAEIEKRFDGLGNRLVDILKEKFNADELD